MKRRLDLGKLSDPKIIKFLSAGLLNTIFGYSVYAVLLFVRLPYLIALLVATVSGVIFNYFSFGRIVFQGRSGWIVFGRFIIAYTLIYVVNAALLSGLTVNLLLNPYFGQIICIPISVLLSWFLMSHWVYKND